MANDILWPIDIHLPADLITPEAPHLRRGKIPVTEGEAANVLNDALRKLSDQCKRYCAAVGLFSLSQQKEASYFKLVRNRDRSNNTDIPLVSLWTAWRLAAGNTAAMAARDFEEALQQVSRTSRLVPSWITIIRSDRLKAARKNFQATFANARDARDAAAHSELSLKDPDTVSISGTFEAPRLSLVNVKHAQISYTSGDAVLRSMKGKIVSAPVSREAAIAMISATALVFSAFDEIDSFPR